MECCHLTKKQDSSFNKSGRNRQSKVILFTIIYDFNKMSMSTIEKVSETFETEIF